MKKCHYCNGSGKATIWKGFNGDKLTKPCKKCHGKGAK